jgi:pSer/pThr/pTyr-binding forkhead associated (FHA) protein/tetratricopeptide (TPR) repeat protein
MFKLIIEDDEGKTTVVPLTRDETTVGRKEGNTIRLTERNVSRRHARILRHDGTVYVEDVGSYNGVKVNGNRIAGRVSIAEGDRVQIGDYLLGIKVDRTTSDQDPFPEQRTQPTPRVTPVAIGPVSAFDATAPHPAASATETSTARMSTLASAAPEAPEAEEPTGPARLVVLSDNFFGREFPLDKAAVVIGRTDENDVVVNHRSVSRHHAKIVREQGRYTIIDLQSANGVRVNGEEYGKVELRRGDLVDLGHVRLRFVEAGEAFIPERDATLLVQMPGPRRGKTLVVAVVGLVCAAAAGFLVWRANLFGSRPVVPGVLSGVDAGAAVPTGPTARAGDAGAAVAPAGEAAVLLADVDRLVKEERWDQAIKRCGEGLEKNPNLELLQDKRAKAQVEQRNQDALTILSEAVDKREPDRAHEAFRKIPDDSVYKRRADDLWTRARPQFVKDHLRLAGRLKGEGRCDQMKREVELVLTMDHGNIDAARLLKECRAPAVAVAPPPKKPPRDVDKPPPPPDVKAAPIDDEKAKTLVDQAAAAFARGQNAQAISLAQQATKFTRKPGLLNRANATMALGHCSSGRKDAAQRLTGKLDGAWKSQVKALCKSKGIDLD